LSAFTCDSDLTSSDPARRGLRRETDPKLAVVIPAFNEAATIGAVVGAVPRDIPRVRSVEVIVVDDGSSDATAAIAHAAGADRIERHRRNRGLVETFRTGVNAALAGGADVVVHLDADGQHDPRHIPRVVAPILLGDADVVVGVRPLADAAQITPVRRHGNRIGSWVIQRMTKLSVSDVTSGYRAFSREALLRLNVISEFTYTLETLIRSARMRLAVAEVTVPALRRRHGQSRMTRSVTRYIGHAGGQAFRTMLHTNPLTIFGRAALAMFAASVLLTGWFLVSYQSGGMHLPALLAALLSFVLAVTFFVSGLIADGISTSHRLLEELLYRTRRIEHDLWGERTQASDIADDMQPLELAQVETIGVGSR
jgi:glycosyltransferase involved in cell wall biosynthesis